MFPQIRGSIPIKCKKESMIAPRIEFSDRAERLEFVQARFHCKAPACGGCGSCNLPGGKSALETFSDYIDGKTEFSAIASTIWKGVH